MIPWNEAARLKRESDELSPYAIPMSVVLSLVFSLAVIAIMSKTQVTNYVWLIVAAIAVPITITLYFKHRIVRLGAAFYVAALILFLGAAVVFGI